MPKKAPDPPDPFLRPRHVAWTCDPAGKNKRLELRKAGFNVRAGNNAKAFGINLVTRWLRSGRLKIVRSLCPNLCREAPRYRYASARDGFNDSEEPINEFNHGMDAMRYNFSKYPPPPPLALAAVAASPAGPGGAPTSRPWPRLPRRHENRGRGAGWIMSRCGRGYAEHCKRRISASLFSDVEPRHRR